MTILHFNHCDHLRLSSRIVIILNEQCPGGGEPPPLELPLLPPAYMAQMMMNLQVIMTTLMMIMTMTMMTTMTMTMTMTMIMAILHGPLDDKYPRDYDDESSSSS